MTALDLSVVVPVRNEEENILPLVTEIHAALDGKLGFEIVYVNDGSDDATPAMLKDARGKFKELRVIHHDRACGQSRAVKTGIQAARAPHVATLDGDGQNDPASIWGLWQAYTKGGAPDPNLVVCGHRKNRKDTGWRRFVSKTANKIRSWMLGDSTPDSGCGLKLFSRAAFLDLPTFDHMHRFLPPLFMKQGRTVISVEVNHRPRERGTSKYGTWDRAWAGLWDLLGVAWLQKRSKYPGSKTEDD
jgi:dolichol-phosphate mannosyltransferase